MPVVSALTPAIRQAILPTFLQIALGEIPASTVGILDEPTTIQANLAVAIGATLDGYLQQVQNALVTDRDNQIVLAQAKVTALQSEVSSYGG